MYKICGIFTVVFGFPAVNLLTAVVRDSRHNREICQLEVVGRLVLYLPGSQGSQRRRVLSQLGD